MVGQLHPLGHEPLAPRQAHRRGQPRALPFLVGHDEQHVGTSIGHREIIALRCSDTRITIRFADGGNGLHQVLGVVPSSDGHSGMPSTRAGWAADAAGTLPA